MKKSTWRSLETFFSTRPIMIAGPASLDVIAEASQAVGMAFDPDYAEFIARYGGAMLRADPIFGVRAAEVMGDETVVDMTVRFRRQRWPGVDGWYIISMDGGGNPIGIDAEGRVWASYHDGGGITAIAANFEDFLLHRLTH